MKIQKGTATQSYLSTKDNMEKTVEGTVFGNLLTNVCCRTYANSCGY